MSIIRNPELRGILGLILVILIVGTIMAATTGKLEEWTGISIFPSSIALDKIIFVSNRTGSNELYIMNTDGSHQKPLTSNAHLMSPPAISASGKRITFVGAFDSGNQVWSVTPAGGSPERLTSATGPKALPQYSPDGKSLSFIASGKVYISDLNGDNLDPILPTHDETQAAMADRNALPAYSEYAWSPDSKSLAGVMKDQAGNDMLVLSAEARWKGCSSPGGRSRRGGRWNACIHSQSGWPAKTAHARSKRPICQDKRY